MIMFVLFNCIELKKIYLGSFKKVLCMYVCMYVFRILLKILIVMVVLVLREVIIFLICFSDG